MYDVVVVGAGPAGSMTAKTAAERGLEVLLLERELEVGVPDKCGEFLPSLQEMRRLAPDVSDLEGLFDWCGCASRELYIENCGEPAPGMIFLR